MVSAAWEKSSLPTLVDPVNPILRTTSDLLNVLPVSRALVTMVQLCMMSNVR